MPVYDVCGSCGFRHNVAHRCRVRKHNASQWVGVDANAWLQSVPVHQLSEFNVECPFCRARFWRGESIDCCGRGRLQLELQDSVPDDIAEVILSAHVRAHIRRFLIPFLYVGLSFHSAVRYNMAFAMASTGHANRSLPDSTFILGGRTFHRIGSLRPNDGAAAAFAQIYLLDPDDAAARRSDVVGNFAGVLRQPVFHMLHVLLLRYNPWVQQLVASATDDTPNVVWQSDIDVSGMVIGAVVAEPGSRSIVIQKRSAARPEFISDGHALYHTLAYPLLFPTGRPGWHDHMMSWDVNTGRQQRVTLLQWSRHLLMHRDTVTFIQKCERLSLEFYCDLYAQHEARIAAFHSLPRQQAMYRCASYAAVHDQLQRDGEDNGNLNNVGRPMILPSSFVGSPRFYHQLYLDAMALPCRYHKPDLFITITCNPNWPEIAAAVPAGSHWRFHPDIVGRAFMLKFKSILAEITEDEIFGPVLAFVWRVEWQVMHCQNLLCNDDV